MTLIPAHVFDQVLLSVAVFVWILNEVRLGLRSLDSGAKVQDRGSRAVLTVAIYLAIFLGVFFSYRFPSFGITFDPEFVFLAGVALIFAGVVLRTYAVHVLGSYFSFTVATRPNQKVVDKGPYRFVRHPSYTAALLSMFGFFLVLTNGLSFLGFIPLMVGYGYRIRVEEKAMITGIGQDYLNYIKRTKRLIPYIL